MTNPLLGVYLNGKYYDYDPGSYKRATALKNSGQATQNSKSFILQGLEFDVHTITLFLGNTYTVRNGSVDVGVTSTIGISRLTELRTTLGGVGSSMPIYFVAPDGMTYSVIPTGAIEVEIDNPSAPNPTSCEYRVSLTLESTQ